MERIVKKIRGKFLLENAENIRGTENDLETTAFSLSLSSFNNENIKHNA